MQRYLSDSMYQTLQNCRMNCINPSVTDVNEMNTSHLHRVCPSLSCPTAAHVFTLLWFDTWLDFSPHVCLLLQMAVLALTANDISPRRFCLPLFYSTKKYQR